MPAGRGSWAALPCAGGAGIVLYRAAEHQTAREVAEQLLTIAQDQPDPVFRLQAHTILEAILFYLGELAAAQAQAEQGIALYDRQQHRSLVLSTAAMTPE